MVLKTSLSSSPTRLFASAVRFRSQITPLLLLLLLLLLSPPLGVCANDLAYRSGISEEEYTLEAARKNALHLVWRMEVDAAHEALAPSWPVRERGKGEGGDGWMDGGKEGGKG